VGTLEHDRFRLIPSVIASEAKQSGAAWRNPLDGFVATLLAMMDRTKTILL
jgi:hypothetical protein